ncbi:uncharacterized protein LOC135699066 [Ochlerotatus camptorhynchus]|uniref:uncharacterized protein LOC135699066 n=1 Tax=Ochlerotatus camptorhynchus TaxID=644619 RepID=UPI0031DFC0E9
MEKPDIVFNQCRFCLKLIEPLGSFSICGDSEDIQLNPLHDFVQKMLSIEFTAENSHVCSDCFSMWRMIQDYLHACGEAHKIVMASKEFVVRKPWLDNEEEKRMLIGVCRVVKKLYHEMEILLRTVEPSNVYYALDKEVTKRRRSRKRKRSVGNRKGKEKQVSSEPVDAIKEEDPVEIDDSAAFQSEKPIEATKSVVVENEGNDESNEVEDDTILDDSVTIVEPQVDHIDLVDSSNEEAEGTDDEDEYVEDYSSSCYRIHRIHDEEMFKTVCQLCGITTSDMANHLEGHIKESKTVRKEKQQTESDSNSSSSSSSSSARPIRQTKPKPKKKANLDPRPKEVQVNSLKCNVCGVEFTSMLTARLHARLHPFNRTYNSGKSNRDARKMC